MKKRPVTLGAIVTAKAGRDEGRTFVVVGTIDEAYVWIADGVTRKMERPKKKKRMHLKLKDTPQAAIVQRLTDGKPVFDHEVRRWLSHEEG